MYRKPYFILHFSFVLLFPHFSHATHDSGSSLRIIGVSRDLSLIAFRKTGSTSAGPAGKIIVCRLDDGRLVEEFITADPVGGAEAVYRRNRQRALRFMAARGISKQHVQKALTRVPIHAGRKVVLQGQGILRLETLNYGDLVQLTFFDRVASDYRLLHKENLRLQGHIIYFDKTLSYRQRMSQLEIRNKIRAVYAYKKNRNRILVVLHNSYSLFGSHSRERKLFLDLNKSIKDYLWLNVYGFRLYRKKLYDAAIRKFKASIQVKSTHYVAWYNMACSYALLGRTADCIRSLRRLQTFWREKKQHNILSFLRRIRTDRDFDPIRKKRNFAAFMKGLP